MKTLEEYIKESQTDEIIDESLKQWVKKAAATAALATFIIGGASASSNSDVTKFVDDDGNKVEQVTSDEIKDVEPSELHTIRSIPSHELNSANKLKNVKIAELQEDNPNITILKVKKLQSKSTGKICFEIVYTVN